MEPTSPNGMVCAFGLVEAQHLTELMSRKAVLGYASLSPAICVGKPDATLPPNPPQSLCVPSLFPLMAMRMAAAWHGYRALPIQRHPPHDAIIIRQYPGP